MQGRLMKRGVIIFLSLVAISHVYSQILAEKVDTIPNAVKNYDAVFNRLIKEKSTDNSLLRDYRLELNYKTVARPMRLRKNTFQKGNVIIKSPFIQGCQLYPDNNHVVPGLTLKINQSLNGNFSFIQDYYYQSEPYRFSNQLAFSAISRRETYIGIGNLQIVNPQLNYNPTEWMRLSGGVYGAKVNFDGRPYNDFGYNGSVKFVPFDAIRINLYGQYSASGGDNLKSMQNRGSVNAGSPSMYMFPQTSFGGALEFKVNDKFGIEGGLMRQLNPFNGKWVNVPFISPVIYAK